MLNAPSAVMGDVAKRPVVRDWTIARSLEEMDDNGIGTAVLSLSPPGLHHLGLEQVRRLARTVNEHAATLRSTLPTRYGHFAAVPMPDVDGTLAEIAYALDQLRADGIQLMTSYGERYPGSPDFEPVMEELNRRKALVFVHPLSAGVLRTVARLDSARTVQVYPGYRPLRLQPSVHRNALSPASSGNCGNANARLMLFASVVIQAPKSEPRISTTATRR